MCIHWRSDITGRKVFKGEAIIHFGRNKTVMEVLVGLLYLNRLIHVNEPFLGEPWISME